MSERPPEPPRFTWHFSEPDEPLTLGPVLWRRVGETEWHESPGDTIRAGDLPAGTDIEYRSGHALGRLRVSLPPEPSPWSDSAFYDHRPSLLSRLRSAVHSRLRR